MSDETSDALLHAVQAVAITPASAKKVVARLRAQSEKRNPRDPDSAHQERVADHVITRYARLGATTGALTGLSGIIPGPGTAIAIAAGGVDAVASMKLQVDMCVCMAAAFGHDIEEPDALHLAYYIAAAGTLEQAGKQGAQIATKAGVNMLRQYLRGALLQALKEIFKKLGLTFTRKALEKALPFGVGVVVGAGGNYALTRYVGAQAKQWFVLDRETPRE